MHAMRSSALEVSLQHCLMWQLQDGQYLDGATTKLYLTMATYNTMRTTLSYISVTFSWIASGSIQAGFHINTMPTVAYVNAHNRYACTASQRLCHAVMLGCVVHVAFASSMTASTSDLRAFGNISVVLDMCLKTRTCCLHSMWMCTMMRSGVVFVNSCA